MIFNFACTKSTCYSLSIVLGYRASTEGKRFRKSKSLKVLNKSSFTTVPEILRICWFTFLSYLETISTVGGNGPSVEHGQNRLSLGNNRNMQISRLQCAELGATEAGPLATLVSACLRAKSGHNLAGNSDDERAAVG